MGISLEYTDLKRHSAMQLGWSIIRSKVVLIRCLGIRFATGSESDIGMFTGL
jgi:hypothetical protein